MHNTIKRPKPVELELVTELLLIDFGFHSDVATPRFALCKVPIITADGA